LAELMEEHVALKMSYGTLNRVWVTRDVPDQTMMVEAISRISLLGGVGAALRACRPVRPPAFQA
jgi:hypothetical protein